MLLLQSKCRRDDQHDTCNHEDHQPPACLWSTHGPVLLDRPRANTCKTGMKSRVITVETESPPITALASGMLASLPSPMPRAIGASPKTVARDVMRIGRMRSRPA